MKGRFAFKAEKTNLETVKKGMQFEKSSKKLLSQIQRYAA